MRLLVATVALTIAVQALGWPATSPAQGTFRDDIAPGEPVELDDDDIRTITLLVLARNPLLASSPGVKAAGAQRSVRNTDIADLVYYPHSNSAGIKEAFQVQCWRPIPDGDWTCQDPEIRRYLQLDSQEFEVRVKGDLESAEAFALIESTRQKLQAGSWDSETMPSTAVMILPFRAGYLVTWGSPEGYARLTMQAYLREGGNPQRAEDWQADFYVSETQ